MNPSVGAPADASGVEVFLQPGQWHFGGGDARVRTLLGSCIAISVWHPRLRIGGLCHFMLPTRQRTAAREALAAPGGCADRLDGRYGDEAMFLLLRAMHASGAPASQFEAKLFGGGRMFGVEPLAGDVPLRNIEAARALVRQHGLRLRAEHLGGHGHRHLVFELASGHAYLRFWGHGAQRSHEGAPATP